MQIRQRITPAVLAAATGMLQPFIPELSPESLVSALKNHESGKPSTVIAEKPLTRQEASALLSVSLNTVDRYITRGIIRRIPMGPRLVRIDPISIRGLLAAGTLPEA